MSDIGFLNIDPRGLSYKEVQEGLNVLKGRDEKRSKNGRRPRRKLQSG